MRLHFLAIPIFDSAAGESELNGFVATHRIVAMDRQLIIDGPRSAWAICISYVQGWAPGEAPCSEANPLSTTAPQRKPLDARRVDYRDTLPPAEFQVFAKLRALRKTLSERDGVPPYALFTNDQLAQMVQRRAHTLAELGQIDGIGPARLGKYGQVYMDDIVRLCSNPAQARVTLTTARACLQREQKLELKPSALMVRSEQGMPFLGFRILPGALRLLLRRRCRYQAERARWEAAFTDGVIDERSLQVGMPPRWESPPTPTLARGGVPSFCETLRLKCDAGCASCGHGGEVQMGPNRMIRGGSRNENARNLREVNRNDNPHDRRDDNLGFRLARVQRRSRRFTPEPTFAGPLPARGRRKLSGHRCGSSGHSSTVEHSPAAPLFARSGSPR